MNAMARREENGSIPEPLQRADEVDQLLTQIKHQITTFIANADTDFTTLATTGHASHPTSHGGPRTSLLEHHPPTKLSSLLPFSLPPPSPSPTAYNNQITTHHQCAVNTWHQGFLSKLYSTPHPSSLPASLLLDALNTNLHVYQVSPALTVIEKETSRALAALFGLKAGRAGGVSMPGGSSANHSALVIARNVMFPETKEEGVGAVGGEGRLVVFTSKHGHYSVEKACQMVGLGSGSVRTVAVDGRGRMVVGELEREVKEARGRGEVPFFVNATAGTTVLGSFDPLREIGEVCRREKLWFHVDASWGGGVVFSERHRGKVEGSELADTITVCPHKMLNIAVTCSFLLGKDLRQFHHGMTLPAGYLFHGDDSSAVDGKGADLQNHVTEDDKPQEFWDLADLTPQCGRRGDSLKLALTWTYMGTEGIGQGVDHAFDVAKYMADEVKKREKFTLVSQNPPPCLQVCFYYDEKEDCESNSKITAEIARALVPKGFMTDYAPGEKGKFFRVVINSYTRKETVDGLLNAIDELGKTIKISYT